MSPELPLFIQGQTWTVGGKTLAKYVQSVDTTKGTAAGTPTPLPATLTGSSLAFYWVAAGTNIKPEKVSELFFDGG